MIREILQAIATEVFQTAVDLRKSKTFWLALSWAAGVLQQAGTGAISWRAAACALLPAAFAVTLRHAIEGHRKELSDKLHIVGDQLPDIGQVLDHVSDYLGSRGIGGELVREAFQDFHRAWAAGVASDILSRSPETPPPDAPSERVDGSGT